MPISGFELLNGAHSCFPPEPETRCAVRACPYPHADSDLVCSYHQHFFDYPFSMTWGSISVEDIFDEDDPNRPVLSVVSASELSGGGEDDFVVTLRDKRVIERESAVRRVRERGWSVSPERPRFDYKNESELEEENYRALLRRVKPDLQKKTPAIEKRAALLASLTIILPDGSISDATRSLARGGGE